MIKGANTGANRQGKQRKHCSITTCPIYSISTCPITLCLNTLHFNYFKGIFHTFLCVFMYLQAATGYRTEEFRPPPLQAIDTPACRIHHRQYITEYENSLFRIANKGWRRGGCEPNRSKCKRRGYSFPTRILTKLFENLNKLYCWPCVLFCKDWNSWTSTGYCDLNSLCNAIQGHARLEDHIKCFLTLNEFGRKELTLVWIHICK